MSAIAKLQTFILKDTDSDRISIFFLDNLRNVTLPLVLLHFSLPGQSPGRAIVLPPALAATSALAKC